MVARASEEIRVVDARALGALVGLIALLQLGLHVLRQERGAIQEF